MELTRLGPRGAMPAPESPTLDTTRSKEPVTMSTEAHTMAGLLASAGAARLGAVTLAECPTAPAFAPMPGATSVHQGSGTHMFSTWTQGAIAKPATYMVDRKRARL